MIKFELGVDALDWIKTIPKEIWKIIDTVVWDPPYLDPKEESSFNDNRPHFTRSKKFRGDMVHTRIMNADVRRYIYRYIYSKISEDAHIIHFHSRREEIQLTEWLACEHVWVKPIEISPTGGAERNNGEHIVIEGPPIKERKQVISKYLVLDFPKKHKGTPQIVRACAKPRKLFDKLYHHLNSKFVLDPFAGWGASIESAINRGISIYACDIDTTLNIRYEVLRGIKTLEGWNYD